MDELKKALGSRYGYGVKVLVEPTPSGSPKS
jgi:hypothetical protein